MSHITIMIIVLIMQINNGKYSQARSSPSQMFFKIGVLKNFPDFTGKHLCWRMLDKCYAT